MDAKRVKWQDDVTFEVAGERAVLLDPSGTEMITLSPIGTLVWQALGQPAAPEAVAADLHGRFPDVPLAEIEADVTAFLDELAELGLVVGADAAG